MMQTRRVMADPRNRRSLCPAHGHPPGATIGCMATTKSLAFGYNPPTGDRGLETIHPATFVADLHRALDIAARGFSSFWVSDHLQFGAKYRLEF